MPGQALDRIGIFKARALEWWTKKAKSGAVMLSIRLEIIQQQGADSKDWSEVWAEGHETYASVCLVKKNGEAHDGGIENLIEALNWSGDFNDFSRTPKELGLPDCRIEVEYSEYNGKGTYQVKWLNPIDWDGPSRMSEDELKSLQDKFGANARALAGNVKRNSDAPPPPQASEWEKGVPAPKDDDIPF